DPTGDRRPTTDHGRRRLATDGGAELPRRRSDPRSRRLEPFPDERDVRSAPPQQRLIASVDRLGKQRAKKFVGHFVATRLHDLTRETSGKDIVPCREVTCTVDEEMWLRSRCRQPRRLLRHRGPLVLKAERRAVIDKPEAIVPPEQVGIARRPVGV